MNHFWFASLLETVAHIVGEYLVWIRLRAVTEPRAGYALSVPLHWLDVLFLSCHVTIEMASIRAWVNCAFASFLSLTRQLRVQPIPALLHKHLKSATSFHCVRNLVWSRRVSVLDDLSQPFSFHLPLYYHASLTSDDVQELGCIERR